MATKTYAQLTAASDILDADLMATYRGSDGPLKRVTATQVREYVQSVPAHVVVQSKSTSYTVTTDDIGNLFLLTATLTLTLPSLAAAGEGFSIAIRNTGTGVITVDPDSAELIDGRSSILVYPGEGFQIEVGPSAWGSIGRPTSVTCFTGSTSGQVSEYEISQGFGDTEFQSYQVSIAISGTTTSAKARLAFKVGGSYPMTHNFGSILNVGGTITGQSVVSASGIEITNHNRVTGGNISIGGARATTNDRGPYASFGMLESATGTSLSGTGDVLTTSGIQAAKFFYSAGNIDIGAVFQVIGFR